MKAHLSESKNLFGLGLLARARQIDWLPIYE